MARRECEEGRTIERASLPFMTRGDTGPVMSVQNLDCSGYCRDCGREHVLAAEPALGLARELLADLERFGGIGLGQDRDPRLSLDVLYGPGRGQMFGVLKYRDKSGDHGVLKAFSGQYNGLWHVPGWVAPILDTAEFDRVIRYDEPRIKELTARMRTLMEDDPLRLDLLAQRRELSRDLMTRIFNLYRLTNFRGRTRAMGEVFTGQGMPTGTGECCAPKLLHHAAVHGLTPLGLAEFYVGRENRSATRSHGQFFPPCRDKCRPILGFMLCGLEERQRFA